MEWFTKKNTAILFVVVAFVSGVGYLISYFVNHGTSSRHVNQTDDFVTPPGPAPLPPLPPVGSTTYKQPDFTKLFDQNISTRASRVHIDATGTYMSVATTDESGKAALQIMQNVTETSWDVIASASGVSLGPDAAQVSATPLASACLVTALFIYVVGFYSTGSDDNPTILSMMRFELNGANTSMELVASTLDFVDAPNMIEGDDIYLQQGDGVESLLMFTGVSNKRVREYIFGNVLRTDVSRITIANSFIGPGNVTKYGAPQNNVRYATNGKTIVYVYNTHVILTMVYVASSGQWKQFGEVVQNESVATGGLVRPTTELAAPVPDPELFSGIDDDTLKMAAMKATAITSEQTNNSVLVMNDRATLFHVMDISTSATGRNASTRIFHRRSNNEQWTLADKSTHGGEAFLSAATTNGQFIAYTDTHTFLTLETINNKLTVSKSQTIHLDANDGQIRYINVHQTDQNYIYVTIARDAAITTYKMENVI